VLRSSIALYIVMGMDQHRVLKSTCKHKIRVEVGVGVGCQEVNKRGSGGRWAVAGQNTVKNVARKKCVRDTQRDDWSLRHADPRLRSALHYTNHTPRQHISLKQAGPQCLCPTLRLTQTANTE
jgi:hypothetical protein